MTVPTAAERLIDVVELLAENPDGLALSEVGRRLQLAKSVTHRLLAVLTMRGYAEQAAGREAYRLTLRLPALGFRIVAQSAPLAMCQPVLDRLAAETGELVRLTLADRDGLIWVAKAQGARPGLRYDPDMGSPVVLHATASGRAWLASMPRAIATALVEDRGFAVPERFGPQTVTNLAELATELNATARRGYAIAIGEGEPGTAAVAMAIPAIQVIRALGTISVAGPVARMTAEARALIMPHLAAAVAEIGGLWPILTADGVR